MAQIKTLKYGDTDVAPRTKVKAVSDDDGNGLDALLDAKEEASNKVKEVTSSSTDTEYPSAKAVYNLLDLFYPVGTHYSTSNGDFDPNEKFKGTWELLDEGTFLMAGSKSGTYPVGSTGGEAKHTLTVDEMPSHSHTLNGFSVRPNTSGSQVTMQTDGNLVVYSNKTWASGTYKIGSEYSQVDNGGSTEVLSKGGNTAHNNLPPYKAVYIWERTA